MVGFAVIPKPIQTDTENIFKDNQDIININISLIESTLQTIDNYRNRFNIQSIQLDSSLTEERFNLFKSTHAQSPEYQESRAHCFLRMLGLPIVQPPDGKNFYSPGFDPEGNASTEITQQKLQVAKLYTSRIINLLNKRENYPGERLKLFQNKSTNATVLIVANSLFPRPMDRQVAPGENPLDPPHNIGDFVVPERNIIRDKYINKNQAVTIFPSISSHMTTLLYLDPRIDFTCGRNQMSVPFQQDKTLTQFSMGANQGIQLPRPYIENVIRQRLSAGKFTGFSSSYAQSIETFIKNNTSINSKDLIANISGSTQHISYFSQNIYARYIKFLQASVKLLVINKKIIDRFSSGNSNSSINWDPIPNIHGADFTPEIREVSVDDNANTPIEIDIINDQSRQLFQEMVTSVGLNKTDLGNSLFNNIDDIIFAQLKQEPNNIAQHKEEKEKKRNLVFGKLNQAARNIELLTGESTGLGFIDILIFQAAFWSMELDDLLGLIDVRAYKRMNQFPDLKTDLAQQSISTALSGYLKEISNLYKLAEFFYQNELNNNNKIR